jgi:hypothetical protein
MAAPLQLKPDGLRDVHDYERVLASCALGLSTQSVKRFAAHPNAARLLIKTTSRESKLDPFKPYTGQRWNRALPECAAR